MIELFAEQVKDVWLGIACEGKEVFATNFAYSKERLLKGMLESLPFDIPFRQLEIAPTFVEHVVDLLKNIYDGKEVALDVALAKKHLSDYRQKVLETVSRIPLGYVASYRSVANAAGGSPRAVGHVMATNPFAPLVPCHRVVRSDFTLGGYGGGLDVKLAFLKRECRGYSSEIEVAANGRSLNLSPTELVLKKLKKDKGSNSVHA